MKLVDTRGQGLIEYVLLLALLVLVAGGTAVVVGPGIGNVYSQVAALVGGGASAPAFTLEGNAGTATPVATPAVAPEGNAGAATPVATPTIQCAEISIAGSASFRDVNNDGRAETVRFGGSANCSQVTDTAIADDPLASRAGRGRLRCVAVDPLTLDLQYVESAGSVTYQVTSGPATLRLLEKRNGATLLSATLTFGELVVSTRSGSLSATVSGVGVDNSIQSPTLEIFGRTPASRVSFALPDTSRLLTLDSQSGQYRLARRSVSYTARLATACGQ